MARDFNETDKKKKQTRIQLPENPENLSKEMLSRIEELVKGSLREGNLPCPTAWKIARQLEVPRIAVGTIVDRLGIRITNCQVGCFKVDKLVHEGFDPENIDDRIIASLEQITRNKELTCEDVFDMAKKLKVPPLAIADTANWQQIKIHNCQLGCF
jgi:hypothetical protein